MVTGFDLEAHVYRRLGPSKGVLGQQNLQTRVQRQCVVPLNLLVVRERPAAERFELNLHLLVVRIPVVCVGQVCMCRLTA